MPFAGAPTAERNIITVLAVDMVGSTRHIAACDPDDAQAFLDHWLAHIRNAVEHAGGVIVHYAGDGGIAIFGWPSAFEDHAERACIAAWDIQSHGEAVGPAGNPVTFRVGLHSGLVGLRKGGRNAIARFDVAGATVHVAAKLQRQALPGEVLVSAETAKLCRSSPLDLVPRHASAEIGDRVVEVGRLNAKPSGVDLNDAARRYQNPIVDRIDEMAVLRERLPRFGGESCAVALVGEAGIGKSRLATAALTEALASEARCCVFYGAVQRRVTAFAAARTLVGDLLGASGLRSDDQMRKALADLQVEPSDLRKLESLFIVGKSRPRQRFSESTQTQIARALVHAFVALALTRPTFLLIEDLQWVDTESRLFLEMLAHADTPQPLCVLLTSRPESTDQAGAIAATTIHLQPLSQMNMEALGRQLWPKNRSQSVLDRAIERADGVPFILEELLRSADADDSAQLLPQSVASMIHARLQRLSPRIKSLAQTLSLLGEEVDIALATAVLGVEVGELLNGLFELERFAFVHPLVGNSTRFRHQMIAEACADTIPRDQCRKVHRAAIQAITLTYPTLQGRYEQLAFHAEEAGETEAAVGYLFEAASEARRNGAGTSLRLIFDRALGLIERLGEAGQERYVDFVLSSCAFLLQLGEFKKMNEHLARAMELAQRQGRAAQMCAAQSQLGMVYWFEGRYEDGLRVTSEGLKTARALAAPPMIFTNQLMLANALHGMGQVNRAISILDELIEMLTGELATSRLGSPASPKCMALAFKSFFMNATGRYEEALEFADRALEIAVRERDLYAEVLARSAMGRNLLMLHRDGDAVECLTVARDLTERNGYDAIKADLIGSIAMALARTGHAGEAIGLVESCLENGMHLRTGEMEVCYLHLGYAEALKRAGYSERWLPALERALLIARTISNPWLIVECLGLRARLLAETAPHDPRIVQDIAEQRVICDQFGIVPFDVPRVAA